MQRRLLLWCLGGAMVLAADSSDSVGIRPRRSPSDYRAQTEQSGLKAGALVLSSAEVSRLFGKEVNRDYLVVEVGVYPAASAGIDLRTSDFTLRAGANQTAVRPIPGDAIAAALYHRKPGNPQPRRTSETDVVTETHVGYESGPRVYDPNTGRTRGGGGVYAGGGVGVINGPANSSNYPDPNSRNDDARRSLQGLLEDRALPEGQTRSPVAGYLYFPVTAAKRRKVAYELLFDVEAGRLTLPLPASPEK